MEPHPAGLPVAASSSVTDETRARDAAAEGPAAMTVPPAARRVPRTGPASSDDPTMPTCECPRATLAYGRRRSRTATHERERWGSPTGHASAGRRVGAGLPAFVLVAGIVALAASGLGRGAPVFPGIVGHFD